jgi:ubiquinone/menaquinone biosynthesis C-methylase UbiE
MSPVQADFDRIALLRESAFDHNSFYHHMLLRDLGDAARGEVLDVGCGTGQFTRVLARQARRVVGLDFSTNMIAAARERSAALANVKYVQADATTWDWPVARFDCVVSIATLHHLPLEPMLERMKRALRPGGRIGVLDLCAVPIVWNAAALPASLLLRLYHERRLLRDPEVRRVWDAHAATDRYLTVREVREICARVLPGARVRRHLLWRYSITGQ